MTNRLAGTIGDMNLLLGGSENTLIGITAGTTRTQAGAVALTAEFNRVDTSTAPSAGTILGDGVYLPMATKNPQTVYLHNNTANPIQAYASSLGTDTINGVAGATGITIVPNAVEAFCSFGLGAWAVDAGMGFSGQLPTMLAADNITANVTGTQAAATALTADMNRVATAANTSSPWSAVKLPPSAPGLDIYVINHGANPIGVFGSGTDTIDDAATATGVIQMQGSVTIYTCTTAGTWYSEGIGTGYSGSFPTVSNINGLSANSGAVQAGATPITACINRFTTVGGAGYSSVLPASVAGMQITVINAGANTMNVFPAGTDTINGGSAGAAVSLATGKTMNFYCANAGAWHGVLSA